MTPHLAISNHSLLNTGWLILFGMAVICCLMIKITGYLVQETYKLIRRKEKRVKKVGSGGNCQ